jgi:hypothetical protein
MRKKITKVLFSISTTALLAACGGAGGGGASSSNSQTSASAEGVYGGTLTGSNSNAFQMLVLENDELWTMYGIQSTSGFIVSGFLQGQGQYSNGGYTSGNLRDFGYIPALEGTANASYNATAKTITGSTTFSGTNVIFNGGPISGSLYNYASAANVSTVAGA